MNPSVDSWYPGKSKPLSKTNPTLVDKAPVIWLNSLHDKEIDLIQSCTVDRAEHERIIRSYDKVLAESYDREERLKKKLELAKSAIINHGIVDSVAEVERLKAQSEEYAVIRDNKILEIERLKKDFSGQLDKAKRAGQYAFNNGLVEGERRAMQRVKETIYKVSKEIYWEGTANEGKKQILRTLLDELGLGEDKTFNPATDHHNCSAGTCAACGHFDSDISFEEEDSDNNNYQNKEDKT